jgi:hypothetical protein
VNHPGQSTSCLDEQLLSLHQPSTHLTERLERSKKIICLDAANGPSHTQFHQLIQSVCYVSQLQVILYGHTGDELRARSAICGSGVFPSAQSPCDERITGIGVPLCRPVDDVIRRHPDDA